MTSNRQRNSGTGKRWRGQKQEEGENRLPQSVSFNAATIARTA